jgi:hypothetical protein
VKTSVVNRLLRKWQHKMRLDDWDIRYDPDADAGEEHACISFLQLARTATLAMDNETDDCPELYIIHELSHLLIRDLCDTAYADIIKRYVEDPKTLEVFAKILADEEEKICWNIAKILFVEEV